MKTFFGQLNQEREAGRCGKWMSHRQEINRMIEQAAAVSASGDEVIIMGAGNCDDLDLPYLASRFVSVTLADIDEDAMKTAVARLEPLLQKKMRIVDSFDFTQLDQIDFYARFQSLLDNQMPSVRMISFLREISSEIGGEMALNRLKGRYSVVISSAVHTQLFYLHTLSLFAVYAKLYAKTEIKQIVEGIAQLRDVLLRKYNDMLFSLAKSKGTLVVWTDMVLLDKQTDFIWETMYSLANEAERAKYMLRLMVNYGIEAAVFAIQDIDQRLSSEGKLLRSWLWPFNDEKQFITVGIAGQVKA